MSFLAPLYLTLAAAAIVPLLLHLLRKRVEKRVEFPAARYLVRAEDEHRRTVRLRNLLLMLLRVFAILFVALAAARPVSRLLGSGHGPTALAIVVDNTLSSGAVVGGRRAIDELKEVGAAALSRATPADRIWIVTADGTATGGTALSLAEALAAVQPHAGATSLNETLIRAAALVNSSGLDSRQIAVLTDGQRTSWQDEAIRLPPRTSIFVPAGAVPRNRSVSSAEPRPLRWTPRGSLAVRFGAADSVSYRVLIGDRTLARGTAAPEEEIVLQAAPPERGWLAGRVEIEPDEMPGDDTRHFALWIGAPARVAISPSAGVFVQSAAEAIRASGRITFGGDVAVVAADQLSSLPALIVAPADPVRVGAANRALERQGIPWRLGSRMTTATDVEGEGLSGVTARLRYQLVPQAGFTGDTLALAAGEPWIVATDEWILVASPIIPEATSLPVKANFVPWLARALTERLAGGHTTLESALPGARIRRPLQADGLETPSGVVLLAGDSIDLPAVPGVYFFVESGRRIGAVVLNPPESESDLIRFTADELQGLFSSVSPEVTADPAAWSESLFRSTTGRPLASVLFAGALAVLLTESILVALRRRAPETGWG